jgi:hypothetical protein
MNTIQRIPRPIGATELGKLYNNTKDNDYYIKLHENIIHHYIRNNFSYCGEYMNIERFSFISGISDRDIKKGLVSYGEVLKGISDDVTNSGIMRASFEMAFMGILEDRSIAQQQYSILAKEQNGQYVPFLSAEVGKAIKLMMDGTGNIVNFMKSMGTGSTAFVPENGPTASGPQGVTVDEVVMLMKAQNVTPLLQDATHQEKLFLEHNLSDAPNVDARTQTGIDTSREGLNMNRIADLQTLKEPEMEILEDKVTKHSNRRAKQLGLDMEDI